VAGTISIVGRRAEIGYAGNDEIRGALRIWGVIDGIKLHLNRRAPNAVKEPHQLRLRGVVKNHRGRDCTHDTYPGRAKINMLKGSCVGAFRSIANPAAAPSEMRIARLK
jgi:hypothetical protein